MKTETLYNISADLSALEELLYETGGEIPGEAEAAIDAWFEELGARRDAKVDSYCALIRNLEARAAYRRGEAQPMLDEANRLMERARIDTNTVSRAKGRLLAFFERHHIATIETGHFRVTAANNGGVRPLTITAPVDAIPDEFVELRREPLKGLIREILERGESLPFAELGEGAIHSDQVMITALIAIGAAAFGIIAGFFLGAWIRQDSINGLTEENRRLRAELALTRGNEGRWQIAVAELKAQLEDAKEMMN